MLVFVALICAAFPVSAAPGPFGTVAKEGTVFIGEKGLDVSACLEGSDNTIAWWAPGTSLTEVPGDTETVSTPTDYYISPDTFVGETGNWYVKVGGEWQWAFNVKEPSLNVKILDVNADASGKDVSGSSIPVNHYANFRVETNLYAVFDRNPTATDTKFIIKVKSTDGGVYSSLRGLNGVDTKLSGLRPSKELWYWVGGNTLPAKVDGWNTGAVDNGNRMYKAGTYTVWAECNANGIKDNYKAPDGSDYTGKTISAVKSISIITDQVKIEANKDTVVRGNPFSVTINGVPNEAYYIWVKGTGSMAGTTDDQPPMILTAQDSVSQDDPNGAYEIGNYVYEGSAGKKLVNDVPKQPYNGVKYYASVKLNNSGARTVEFQTSKDTKDKKYTIRVEKLTQDNQYKSDEVDITVEKGDVTVVASGDQSYYLGEEVKLSGTNSETESTYLFITGPNLATAGAQLSNPQEPVTDDQSFDRADVQDDDTWEFKWQTANLQLDAGTYTIYALSAPKNRDALNEVEYDTVSLVIKKPFIQATASASVVAKGDKLYVRGTAEGDPSPGIAIWVLGKNKVLYATESVNDDMSFEYEIDSATTSNLYAGQYFVVVQHPMYNNKFDVYPDNSATPQQVLGDYPTDRSVLFTIQGAGSLQGTDAAEALVQAIDSAMVDDTYTKLQFLVEEPKVTINPIGEQSVGSKFDISGTTNLDYDDNDLLVEVTSSSFKPTEKSQSGEFSGATGTVKVVQGTDGLNKWSFTVDGSTFKPDEYIVRVSGVTTDVVETTLFNVVEATGAVTQPETTKAPVVAPTEAPVVNATPTLAPTTVATTVPPTTVATTVPPTPEPTKKSPGFGALIALAGLGAVAVLVMRRN